MNQLAGKSVVEEGADLASCQRSEIRQSCHLVISRYREMSNGTRISPGFGDTTRTDIEILTETARILSTQYVIGVQQKCIVYIHRTTDVRYNGIAVKTFVVSKKIWGEEALKNVLFVTSRWDGIDEAKGTRRERQLKEKFWALHRGSNISRIHGDRDSAISLVSQLPVRDEAVLQLQRKLVDESMNLNATVAGSYVDDNLEKSK